MTDRLGWVSAYVGFVLLAVPGIVLAGLAVVGAIREAESVVLGGLLLAITLLAVRGIAFELRLVHDASGIESMELTEMVGIAAAIMVGGFVTFALVVEGGLSPVVAASLTGLSAVIARRRLAVPAYCGAFVGMTSPILFPAYWHGLIAALLAIAVYLPAHAVFHGVGGKLGTTAFVGAALTTFGTPASFLSEPLPASDTAGIVVFCSAVAAVATFALHDRSTLNPVSASGVVGLLGGFGLPWLFPAIGDLLAAAIFAGSFAGMSESARIPGEGWMALAGTSVGLIVLFTTPYLGGSGGKLGTVAFVSCLAVYGLLGTVHSVSVRRHIERLPRRDVS